MLLFASRGDNCSINIDSMVVSVVRMRPGAMFLSKGATCLKRPQVVHRLKDAVQYVIGAALIRWVEGGT